MENMKLKLAKNILIEFEAITVSTSVDASLMLAEIITRDAKRLAEIIQEEHKGDSMSKVINIVTRQEEVEPPFNPEYAKELLAYLLEYKNTSRSSMVFSEHVIMRDLIKFLENNSGVNCIEMLEERTAK